MTSLTKSWDETVPTADYVRLQCLKELKVNSFWDGQSGLRKTPEPNNIWKWIFFNKLTGACSEFWCRLFKCVFHLKMHQKDFLFHFFSFLIWKNTRNKSIWCFFKESAILKSTKKQKLPHSQTGSYALVKIHTIQIPTVKWHSYSIL